MSHFSTIKTKIKNKEFLIKNIKKVGYNISQKNYVSGYGNNTISADIVINLPDTTYNIGFKKDHNGYYELIADWYGIKNKNSSSIISNIENEIERIENKIKQEFAYDTTITELGKNGFSIDEEVRENGEIRIRLSRIV